MTSSYSCFCPKYLQQFANSNLLNQQFNLPAQYQQLYNAQLQQARQLQYQQADLYGNQQNFGK